MRITLVKKIMADGAPCRKCAEVEKHLEESGYSDRIDRIVIADERDAESEGMLLATKFQVGFAPFFIVEGDDGNVQIYTVYFRLLKEVLQVEAGESEELAEIMDQNPNLDFI